MAVALREGRRIRIQGTVQGVGFRPWVYRTAHSAGVTGRVRNDSSGVTIEAFGDQDALERFVAALKFPPPAAQILTFRQSAIAPETTADFEIVASSRADDRIVSIPPDLATCPDCLAEIFDPANRRYRYPFTNCTNCGPRFTIAIGIPYDRETTTMRAFEMCDECRREYEDVNDRRFHAQPNACPDCGPRLSFHDADGMRLDVADAIAAAAAAIRRGEIVAVKGIGGFHLACDAASERAVRRLRERKRREEKPLAVMVHDLETAECIGDFGDVERSVLTSVERPIVLVVRRTVGDGRNERSGNWQLAVDALAPGNRMVGLFLPYSPLHHLLLADVGRPLVMTSANLSDEPIAYRNDEALQRLANIADFFLLHDRRIETRCDDSVVTVIAGRPTVFRRSRGYVPRPLMLPRPLSRPVLACGALQKNAFCLASGNATWFGPHIGDLENVETYDAYARTIERMERFLEITPQLIAHDLHPDYLSTRYAIGRPERQIGVQHHHAHIVSAMAEHGIEGPAIGIAYDGTGYGTDGTLWGGEILIATAAAFRRAATFRPVALIGGDRAIREPWRIALALSIDAFDGDVPSAVLEALTNVDERSRQFVIRVLRSGFPAPLARGVGRYFDAFGALFLRRSRSAFEGQVALEWNQVADPRVTRTYEFGLEEGRHCPEIDLRPAWRAAVRDLASGEGASSVSAAFHNMLAEATAVAVRRAVMACGSLPVVASGGCFQNARLAESVRAALAPEHDVLLHSQVPPGDGGIALGQAVIADAIAAG